MNENNFNPLNDILNGMENEGFQDLPFPEMSQMNQPAVPVQAPQAAAVPTAQSQAPVAQPMMQPPTMPQAQVIPQNPVMQAQPVYQQTVPTAQPMMQPPVPQQPVVAPASVIPQPPMQPPVQPTVQPVANGAYVNQGMDGIADAADPLAAALATAKARSDGRVTEIFAAKDAIFNYGKAKEPITDRDCTFEDLRQKYEDDFPELAESKKVEWTVSYGKESKTITNPGSDKVYDIKSEIESSKKFVDGINKAKTEADRSPECIVKPRVKPQSKGQVISLSAHKDLCKSIAEAENNQKAIVLLPSKDGRLYQMRKTEIGTFTAPINHIAEFEQLEKGFKMNLPKIPKDIFLFVLDFFKALSDKYELEALVHILYNTKMKKYNVQVPKQEITKTSVNSVTEEEYPEHLIHVMDIHSHNTMSARFSPTDDDDEKATRLYAVVGKLNHVFPDITVRAGCGGEFIYINPTDVFEDCITNFSHPKCWDDNITIPESYKTFRYKRVLSGERI